MSVLHLDSLFNPKSVAVIGASQGEKSIGGVIMRNLLKGGFNGPIMPINPKYDSIAGVWAYANVAALPLAPDLAIICTPPDTVAKTIKRLGEAGVRTAIVMTGGMSRTHSKTNIII